MRFVKLLVHALQLGPEERFGNSPIAAGVMRSGAGSTLAAVGTGKTACTPTCGNTTTRIPEKEAAHGV